MLLRTQPQPKIYHSCNFNRSELHLHVRKKRTGIKAGLPRLAEASDIDHWFWSWRNNSYTSVIKFGQSHLQLNHRKIITTCQEMFSYAIAINYFTYKKFLTIRGYHRILISTRSQWQRGADPWILGSRYPGINLLVYIFIMKSYTRYTIKRKWKRQGKIKINCVSLWRYQFCKFASKAKQKCAMGVGWVSMTTALNLDWALCLWLTCANISSAKLQLWVM